MSDPTKLRVIAYNVGFGDCFLLSFSYGTGRARHVLVDFGTTRLPHPSRGPDSLEAVASKIAEHCDGKLDMVVATHRHADHISGFAGKAGSTIAALKPELVVLPWTEDPDIAPDAEAPRGRRRASGGAAAAAGSQPAARTVAASLAAMNSVAAGIRARAGALAASRHAPPGLGDALQFLGDTNIKNREAVEALMKLGKRRAYASFGTRLPIASILPGVKVRVLGPPTLEQAPGIANLARKDAVEYWHLAAQTSSGSSGGPVRPLFPRAPQVTRIPQVARWLVPQIDRMNAEEMLGVVRSIDDALNNTSLILLFDVNGTRLLFPGDAQIENWRYALFDAPDAARTRAMLGDTAVYKVGHHGSLNATPKTMWNGLTRRGGPEKRTRLRAVISTFGGKHGNARRGTEVPRRKLLEALEAESELFTTQTLRSKTVFWREFEVPLS
jgi:hypothetical protein